MSNTASARLKQFALPQLAIGRFVAWRAMRPAALWGLVFGLYTISKISGYVQVYPTESSRQKLAESLGTNVGIEALLGTAHHIEAVTGYAVWNMLCILSAGGAIWALLLATKSFRGEEDSGRFELLLSGQTTRARAAANVLAGLGCALALMYILVAIAYVGIGKVHGVQFTTSASLFFALAVVLGAAQFMAVGAFASQLMPVRARAAGLSAAVFGVSYMVRAIADTTSAHWLLDVTPLGWIEKLQPLYASRPIWLVPIGAFILILCVLTILLARSRDLGDSLLADHSSARAHAGLLNSVFAASVRLTKNQSLSWLGAIVLTGVLYGLLTKSAAQAFNSSHKVLHAINQLAHASQVSTATAFLGVVFFLQMFLIMVYTAGAVVNVRDDEAEGYLDNLLVRRVGRLQWLMGRVGIIAGVIVLAGLASGGAVWLGVSSQHIGVPVHELFVASVNAMVPALCTLGLAVCGFGFLPRFTGAIAYGVLGWSFLIAMVSSGINLNHWLLDTSILQHIALAPAASVTWRTDAIIVALGAATALLGAWRFKHRDLETE